MATLILSVVAVANVNTSPRIFLSVAFAAVLVCVAGLLVAGRGKSCVVMIVGSVVFVFSLASLLFVYGVYGWMHDKATMSQQQFKVDREFRLKREENDLSKHAARWLRT